MRLDINRLTMNNGDKKVLLTLLSQLVYNVGAPEKVFDEVERYVDDQSSDLSIETIEWVRKNRIFFKNQLEIMELDSDNG